MENENIKKWLELAQQYQKDFFWKQIFEENGKDSIIKNGDNPCSPLGEFFPKCDLYEENGCLVAEIEIPGIGKEDINLSLGKQLLTITGKLRSLKPNRKYYLKERSNLNFKKEITLPSPVFPDNIQCNLIDGVFFIKMPLSQEETEDIPITVDETIV